MNIEELLVQSLQLLGLGMGAVFIILVLLIGMVTLVSKLVPEEIVLTVTTPRQGVDPGHVAAITAALHQYRKNR